MRTDLLSQHLVSSHVCVLWCGVVWCGVLWCVVWLIWQLLCVLCWYSPLCVCVCSLSCLCLLLLLGVGAATCFDEYVEAQLRVHRVRTVL